MRSLALLALLALPGAALAAPAPIAQANAGPGAAASPAAGTGDWLVAPKLGLFEPTAHPSAAFFGGLEVGYRLPWLGRRLVVALEGSFLQPSASGTVASPQLTVGGQTANGAYTLKEQQLALALLLVYRADRIWKELTPYGGLGPAAYRHQARTTAFGSTTTEVDGGWGLEIVAGAEWRVWHGGPFLELDYRLARVHFISTGSANAGGFLALGAGYRFAL